jgi:hypothetical protein
MIQLAIGQKEIYTYGASVMQINKNKTPWPQSASELHRPSDRHLSTKLVPTFADRGCRVISVTDPYGRILGFIDRGLSRSRPTSFRNI